ncbi:hypothetical protein BDF19DRAFT_447186 [Syncephalis fuscata]|nr:hypothetical protein BDF19DRAFT_447186 [Syncephalis fuscata]
MDYSNSPPILDHMNHNYILVQLDNSHNNQDNNDAYNSIVKSCFDTLSNLNIAFRDLGSINNLNHWRLFELDKHNTAIATTIVSENTRSSDKAEPCVNAIPTMNVTCQALCSLPSVLKAEQMLPSQSHRH